MLYMKPCVIEARQVKDVAKVREYQSDVGAKVRLARMCTDSLEMEYHIELDVREMG